MTDETETSMPSRHGSSAPARYDLGDRAVLLLVEAFFYLRHWRQVRRHYRKRATLPRLARPRTSTEKLLWRRLIDRDPRHLVFADKLKTRDWMQARAPELKLAPLRFVGRTPQEIPPAALEGGVMVKWNCASEQNMRLATPPADRAAFDATFEAWARSPYGTDKAEWSYACVERRIMVEDLLPETPDEPLIDFAVYCCGGEVLFGLMTFSEKRPPTPIGIFELDGTRRRTDALAPVLGGGRVWMTADVAVPPSWPRVIATARKLAQGFDFVRVDLMQAAGELYAAEMTVFVGGGYGVATVPGVADDLRDRWDIRQSWFLTTPQTGWRGVYARALRRSLAAS